MAIQDEYIRITLRIPKELHSLLADSAEQTSKSMNAEILARLQESFSQREIEPELKTLENKLNLTRMLALNSEHSLNSTILALANLISVTPNSDHERSLNRIKNEAAEKLGSLEDFDKKFSELVGQLHLTKKTSGDAAE
ncbi:Arc family DNA-binding protein [Pseudomonas protegens]|uniref:Arc family DNA-binding protein n=1 Tax=Pseudomonas protegens TaxID=380021 RepID=UPI0038183550